MNFSRNAGRTVAVFSKHPGLILKVSAVSFLISLLSLGLLLPSALSGMGVIFLKLHKGEKAGFSGLFEHADKTLKLCVIGLIIALTVFVSVIFIFLPVLVFAIWMYAVFFMAYENRGIGESLSYSANAVVQNSFLGHLIASLVLCIINAAGASFFLVGLIVTLPLTAGFIAFCFEEIVGKTINN